MSENTGMIFNVQRFSTEDGPGIRTTVFFKGCPLRCDWCHNPEGMRAAPELMWYDVRCVAARECMEACDLDALRLTPGGMVIDRERCTACGDCAATCPGSALEVIGRKWTVEELLAEVKSDFVFYETSGGGVTFSGGEPVLQNDFLFEAIKGCKSAGLHTALDTCGALPWERYERLLPFLDLVLFDVKIKDTDIHKLATGAGNQSILENAKHLALAGIPMWVRTPVIPGYTNTFENIIEIGSFINEELPSVERWDLLAYTNLGKPKYHRLDIDYKLEETALLTTEEMEALWQKAVECVSVARWSGATRRAVIDELVSRGGEG